MKQTVVFSDDARNQLRAGIDQVADAVKITLGPKGRNVILDVNEFGVPINTNDGVTIVREILPAAGLERTGAKLVKEVAGRVNDEAGDGTTTASVLVQAIIHHAQRQISAGAEPVLVRRGIERMAELVRESLLQQREKVDIKDTKELQSIATISCGDPEVGKIVADLVQKVGAQSVITLEESVSEETSYEVADGIELRGGLLLPVFITDPATQSATLDDVPVFVTNYDLTSGLEAIKIMEACVQNGYKQAVVIANNISGEAMVAMVQNRVQQKFNLTPIRVMAWGEQGTAVLRDMAAATGATFYASDEGYRMPVTEGENIPWEAFGKAKRIVATKDRTTVLGGEGDVNGRIEEIDAQIKASKKAVDIDNLKQRKARLQKGVGVVSVGGATESEREERKLRIEDAVNATRAAVNHGMLTGGGSALFRAADRSVGFAEECEDESLRAGMYAVIRAAKTPLEQMARNSNLILDRAELAKITHDNKVTIDFMTGELVNGQVKGIIDPFLVVASALKYASSAAAVFITTEVALINEKDD